MNDDRKQYIGKELTGENFKKIFADGDFVKLTNESENHNGVKYHDGLNIDPTHFIPNGKCKTGGLYFIEGKYTSHWIYYGITSGVMRFTRNVDIPDDARVYVEENKFKADKLILKPRSYISDIAYKQYLNYQYHGRHHSSQSTKKIYCKGINIRP